jgi:uncharacterized protein YegL
MNYLKIKSIKINIITNMIQEVVAVIDRSGSMAGKEADTIGGINATIDELKRNKHNEIIKFSVKFFDHDENLKINSLDIENIRPLKIYELRPRGQTALLDAMGNTITHFINKKMCEPSSFESCIIYVATDGLENCSKKYTKDKIKNLIEEAKKFSIEILYLGANQDAIFEASQFGLDVSQALNYSETSEHVECAYRSAARAAKRYRTGENLGFLIEERSASQIN